jgi:hypothetical protein
MRGAGTSSRGGLLYSVRERRIYDFVPPACACFSSGGPVLSEVKGLECKGLAGSMRGLALAF